MGGSSGERSKRRTCDDNLYKIRITLSEAPGTHYDGEAGASAVVHEITHLCPFSQDSSVPSHQAHCPCSTNTPTPGCFRAIGQFWILVFVLHTFETEKQRETPSHIQLTLLPTDKGLWHARPTGYGEVTYLRKQISNAIINCNCMRRSRDVARRGSPTKVVGSGRNGTTWE
ncbi:hypothetical protein CBL_05416 [Carabus blaptoides fortunei]